MLGRDGELAIGRRFLDAVASASACLLLEGEPGIGKTTLWRELVADARSRGYRVLACRPAASEAGLSFAALGDICSDVGGEILAQLPDPQWHALEVALLRAPAGPTGPERRAVLAALSSLLALLAEERPLVVAIDDVQWLDGPSQSALEFALRRVEGRRIGFLGAVRVPDPARTLPQLAHAMQDTGAQLLTLGPLSVATLHDLIAERTGRSFSRPLLVKIGTASRGNPFYALEIAREIARRGEPSAGAALPVPGNLSDLVAARIRRLPGDTRSALLAAAALSRPTVELVDRSALEPAMAADLVQVTGEEVSFSHPLIATAVLASVGSTERRALHRRLATIAREPEERARHLAQAADGPDELTAATLADAADQARSRGAPDAAAELMEMAIELTPSDESEARSARALAAAEHHFRAGDLARARARAEQVLAAMPPGPLRGAALRLLGEIRYHDDSFAEAVPLLEAALREQPADDAQVAAHVDLAYAYVNLGDMAAAGPHGRAAVERALAGGDEGALAVALAASAIVDFYLDQPLDRERIERALALEDPDRHVPMPMLPTLIAGIVFHLTDELERAGQLLRGLRQRTIDRGEESDLPLVDAHLSMIERRAGRLAGALEFADEGHRIARMLGSQTGQALVLGERCYVRATMGDVDGARADAAVARRLGGPEAGFADLWTRWALAFTELSEGNPGAANDLLEPLAAMVERKGAADPVAATFLPDEVEALIELGELDRAATLAEILAANSHRHDRPSILAAGARSLARICAARGDLARAASATEEALAALARVEMPLELGRTLLVAGQIARRARRKRNARAAFEEARAVFERIGARSWADRARAELERTGMRHAAPGELTPTEARVAELAAAGLTNRRIAELAFLSPKTVEANLARIYGKLGIATRAELGRVMAERALTGVRAAAPDE